MMPSRGTAPQCAKSVRSLRCARVSWAALILGLVSWGTAQSNLQVGYAVLSPASRGHAPVGTALFTFKNSTGILVSQAGVGAAEPTTAGRIFVDQAAARTGLAMANPGPVDAALTLVVRDTAGGEAARTTDTLLAGRYFARYVDEIFPSLPKGFSGSLTFESPQRVSAVTLRESRNAYDEPLYATLPVVDLTAAADSKTLVFPQIAAGDGYTTQLVLLNPTSSRISGQLSFTNSAGKPLPLRSADTPSSDVLAFSIEPHGTFSAQLDRPEGIASGYAVASSDPGSALPAGTAIFRFKRAGFLVTEAGVAAARPTTSARIFVDNSDTFTGLALASNTDQMAVLTFTLLDRYGTVLDTSSRTLPSRGHVAVFAHELFTDISPDFTGLIEVASTVAVAAVALLQTDNARGDSVLTTLPVADLTQPPPTASIVFPHVAFGAGFSTRLVFVNPLTTEAATGTLSFFEGSGAPLSVALGGKTNSSFTFDLRAGAGRQLRPGDQAGIASITLPVEVTVNEGNAFRAEALVLDTAGRVRDDFDLDFRSLSTDVATVDSTGSIDGRKAGFSTLTVSGGGVVATSTATVVSIDSGPSGFEITGVAQDLSRRLYLANTADHTILLARELGQTPDVYAGVPKTSGLKNDLRSLSWFKNPAYLTLHQANGILYVTDSANNVIRSVHPGPAGKVVTLASGLDSPQGIVLDGRGRLWIADSGSHSIKRLDPATGAIETVAGKSGAAGWADGFGNAARFSAPTGLALETEPLALQLERERKGLPPPPIRVIVADTGNGLLRRVTESGSVETLRAVASPSAVPRAPRSLAAAGPVLSFASPTGVASDPYGTLYVSEPGADRVRVLLPTGEIVSASQPRTFRGPRGLAVAQSGKLVVAERGRTAQQVTYGAPRIASVSPSTFRTKGGIRVTVKGKNLAADTVVVAAGVLVAATIADTETITFTTPDLQSGRAVLTLQNRGGIAQTSIVVEPPALRGLAVGSITTVAGGGTFSGEGLLATEAPITSMGLALDAAGNVYLADSRYHRIRKVDGRTGVVTTVAGTGTSVSGSSRDNVPATASPVVSPTAAAFDVAGNMYLIDSDVYGVRKVDAATGIITTVFRGEYGECPVEGVSFSRIYAMALDRDGNIYLSDSLNNRIRKFDARTRSVSTVAGNCIEGFSGDGASARSASLHWPAGLALDEASNALYFADRLNDRIRKVDLATGVVTTYAGGGAPADGLGDGLLATLAKLDEPMGVALDAAGNMFVSDGGNYRIRRIEAATGIITTIAGNGLIGYTGDGGRATAALLQGPWGIAVDAAGNVFFSDYLFANFNYVVRKVDAATGIITTIAGSRKTPQGSSSSEATSVVLTGPDGVAVDPAGNVVITDEGNFRVLKLDLSTGIVTTIAGGGIPEKGNGDGGPATGAQVAPNGPVAIDEEGNLYIADTYGYRVRKVDVRTGRISTVAGTGQPGSDGDGKPALEAKVQPDRVALDGRGNIYVTESVSRRIRKIDAATRVITTIAGGGKPASGIGDGGLATDALLGTNNGDNNLGLAVDAIGNVYIADSENRRVRKVDVLTRLITTVAGGGERWVENELATAVGLLPVAVHADAAGNLYVVDNEYPLGIRRISATTGRIRSVAGGTATSELGDGGPAVGAFLYYPRSVVLDRDGNLFIADTDNNRIRAVRGPLP